MKRSKIAKKWSNLFFLLGILTLIIGIILRYYFGFSDPSMFFAYGFISGICIMFFVFNGALKDLGLYE